MNEPAIHSGNKYQIPTMCQRLMILCWTSWPWPLLCFHVPICCFPGKELDSLIHWVCCVGEFTFDAHIRLLGFLRDYCWAFCRERCMQQWPSSGSFFVPLNGWSLIVNNSKLFIVSLPNIKYPLCQAQSRHDPTSPSLCVSLLRHLWKRWVGKELAHEQERQNSDFLLLTSLLDHFPLGNPEASWLSMRIGLAHFFYKGPESKNHFLIKSHSFTSGTMGSLSPLLKSGTVA